MEDSSASNSGFLFDPELTSRLVQVLSGTATADAYGKALSSGGGSNNTLQRSRDTHNNKKGGTTATQAAAPSSTATSSSSSSSSSFSNKLTLGVLSRAASKLAGSTTKRSRQGSNLLLQPAKGIHVPRSAATTDALLSSNMLKCRGRCPCVRGTDTLDTRSASSSSSSWASSARPSSGSGLRQDSSSSEEVGAVCPRVSALFFLLYCHRECGILEQPYLARVLSPAVPTGRCTFCDCERQFADTLADVLRPLIGESKLADGGSVTASDSKSSQWISDLGSNTCNNVFMNWKRRQLRDDTSMSSKRTDALLSTLSAHALVQRELLGGPQASLVSTSSLFPIIPQPSDIARHASPAPRQRQAAEDHALLVPEYVVAQPVSASELSSILATRANPNDSSLHQPSFVPRLAVPLPPLYEGIGEDNDSDVHWLQPSLCALNRPDREREESSPMGSSETHQFFFGGGSFLDLLLLDDSQEDPTLAFREQIRQAMTEPLMPSMRAQISQSLRENPQLVHDAGVTPAGLIGLVENNSAVAFDVIYAMVLAPSFASDASDKSDANGSQSHVRAMQSSHGHDLAAFLLTLLSVELSIQSMELVTKLTAAVELPREFVHLYVAHCLKQCEQVQDQYLRTRLVRLVCVVLDTFVQQGTIDDRDVFIEVQTFCIEYSKIKEAAMLYKTLKALEHSR